MSRASLPAVMVGNEFVMPQPRLRAAASAPLAKTGVSLSIIPMQAVSERSFIPVTIGASTTHTPFGRLVELFHRYSVAAFALLFLLVGSAGMQVGSVYWSAHIANSTRAVLAAKPQAHTIAGLNVTIPSGQLPAKLQSITSQAADITVGGQTLTLSPDTIKSWLQITPSRDKSEDYLRIKSDSIQKSLADITGKFVKAPVNQVTVTYPDGSSAVILAGSNGTKLSDPNGLKQQAASIAKTVMGGKGMHFSAPTESLAFAAVTPAAFDKLIEVNVVTKQMYLYDKGQLTRSYPVSAGASETPTPLGQYRIYEKLGLQDMRGFNADGTKYFQPHVRWISYFKSGGYAIHGNYWRPQSWFGVINSSHGCVSLPDYQAEWVYNWAPIGTTIINHT